MRKTILVLGILLIIVSACVFEMGYTHNVYSGLRHDAIALNATIDNINQGLQDDDRTVRTQETLYIIDNIIRNWQDHKVWLMYCTHHTIILELDKSLIRLNTLVDIDMYEDCKVECNVAINILTELVAYNKLSLQNLF
jgi:hypothetical protein